VSGLRSAANVGILASGVRGRAAALQGSASELVAGLEKHAPMLGIDGTSPRMVSAIFGRDLVLRLAVERDDVVLIDTLAMAPLPAEVQPLSKSLTSAAVVDAALRGAMWDLLASVAGISVADDRHEAARAVLASLAEVARANEMHAPMAPALATAVRKAADILARKPQVIAPVVVPVVDPVIVVPDPPVERHVNDITLDGIDDRLGSVLGQARAALEAAPSKTLKVSWWLE